MDNISILTGFPDSESLQYYRKVAENISGEYTIYTGGNFIYISNAKNRTVRFTTPRSPVISDDQVTQWLERIQQKFPHF